MKTSLTLSRKVLCVLMLTSQFALAQTSDDLRPGGPGKPPRPPQPPVPASCPAPQTHYEDDRGSYILVGNNGRSGRDGLSGTDGRNGQDITIIADGRAVQFNLSGTDGGDAGDGEDGDRASCSSRGRDFGNDFDRDRGGRGGRDSNIEQASGGNGGDAGRPGRGGNGGDATIYFTDAKQLKLIYINAAAGYAGSSGRAGQGGQGCFCNSRQWETNSYKDVTRVVGDQKLTCREPVRTTHYCRDGSDGADGRSSSSSDGFIGSVTLIKSAQPLPQNVTSASLELTQAASSTVTLVKNLFETRSGANMLLANGSIVDSNYSAYVRTAVLPVQLAWKARLPISSFAGTTVSYSMNNDGQSAAISTSAWTIGRSDIIGGKQVFTIERALLQKDAARLSGVISGNGKNTTLTITDDAAVSDLIDQTSIHLNIDSKGVFSHDRFEGVVSANHVRKENNKYIINLYDLWLLNNSQKQADGDLKKGKVLKVNMSVTRTFGQYSASYNFNFDKYKLTDGVAIKD